LVLAATIVVLVQLTLWKWDGDEMDTMPPITATSVIHSTPATLNFTPPFHAKGRHIFDAKGIPLKLASLNWYGASDTDFVPGGLEVQHRDAIAALIRDLGFNSVRLPYADEIVMNNPVIEPSVIAANLDLFSNSSHAGGPTSVRALDVFHAVVESLTAAGLLVIVNNHITQATWCCGINPCDLSWKNDWFGADMLCTVSQTEEQWIRNWETVMAPLVSNPLVMGADLRNEVRGLWGTMHWGEWAEAAEKASERLLAMNPEWLMFVEGISSANDLSGVRKRPVQLSVPGRVVYSAHV
jgi:aryl-phospho-beta-D-glucosidase BglC (GH1 family)